MTLWLCYVPAVTLATVFAGPARATIPVTPAVLVEDENSRCTTSFAAQGNDGSYYLMTSGHCDELTTAHHGPTETQFHSEG